MTHETFLKNNLAAIQKDKILDVLAGTESTHRIIGIWAVAVKGRVFVRLWTMKPRSWWRTFLEDLQVIIVVGEMEITVCAIQTKSEKLKGAPTRHTRRSTTNLGIFRM